MSNSGTVTPAAARRSAPAASVRIAAAPAATAAAAKRRAVHLKPGKRAKQVPRDHVPRVNGDAGDGDVVR